jgi:hypothetical protein
MEQITQFIAENIIILIPVLYILGMIMKNTNLVSDKYIPLILLPIGIGLCVGVVGFSVDAIIQGILVVGASVYANQLYVQYKKEE